MSNLRQIGFVMGMYRNDNVGYMGCDKSRYRSDTIGDTPQAIKDCFGIWYNRFPSQADVYMAHGYVRKATTCQGQVGNPIFICPSARKLYQPILGGISCMMGNVANMPLLLLGADRGQVRRCLRR